MRIVFMGTPSFSAAILKRLSEQHEVLAVYTRPDAVRGRGKKLEPSAVKTQALDLGIPVFTPKTLRDEAVQAELAAWEPDVICVAAFGALLPKEVLSIPRHGCINVHVSLLPRWRGAAPIEHAILSGDEYTGVSIMKMEEGLDTGPYCVCERISLQSRSTEDVLEDMGETGSKALLQALAEIEAGTVTWCEQSEEGCTYACKIEKGMLNPDTQDTSRRFCRKVLASSQAHPAKVVIAGKTVTVLSAHEVNRDDTICQGDVCFKAKKLYLGCKDATVEIERVKPDGKQEMSACSFAAGIQGIKQGGLTWDSL